MKGIATGLTAVSFAIIATAAVLTHSPFVAAIVGGGVLALLFVSLSEFNT